MTAQTPGQAAYEAFLPNGPIDWEYADSDVRAMWKAAAQAAIRAWQADNAAAVLTEPDALDELAKRDEAHARIVELAAHATSLAEDLDDAGATIGDYREALTVMQRERDQLRELAAEMADDVEHLISGNAGYIDRDMVAGYRERAGIEVTP